MKLIADTNLLVRAAVMDDPAQGPAAARAMREASLVAVPTPALCEFVWVLARAYKRPAGDIAAAIRRLLAVANVVADRPAAEMGLAFLEAGGDFADGVIAHEGRVLGGEVFASFDRPALALAQKLGLKVQTPGEG